MNIKPWIIDLFVASVLHGAVKRLLESERPNYPLVDDHAFDLISDVFNYHDHRLLERGTTLYVERWDDHWDVVFENYTQEQLAQSRAFRKVALDKRQILIDSLGEWLAERVSKP